MAECKIFQFFKISPKTYDISEIVGMENSLYLVSAQAMPEVSRHYEARTQGELSPYIPAGRF